MVIIAVVGLDCRRVVLGNSDRMVMVGTTTLGGASLEKDLVEVLGAASTGSSPLGSEPVGDCSDIREGLPGRPGGIMDDSPINMSSSESAL
jgi:hypothetical protein